MLTALLLTVSNVFMTFAWYGHLKFRDSPLWLAILASWLIAFVEYCFQVPANRWGHGRFSAVQLKIMQEVITIAVFCVFSATYLQESVRWNHAVAFGLIVGAVFFVYSFDDGRRVTDAGPSGPATLEAAQLQADLAEAAAGPES